MEFWKAFFSFLEKVLPYAVSLVAVWLGWRLGLKSQAKQRSLDRLMNRFHALREIKSVVDNIPPDLNRWLLFDKLRTEPEFCQNITNRIVRLFGLRKELIPYIDAAFIDLIDNELRPLFIIGGGAYTLKEAELEKFAALAIGMVAQVNSVEKKLIKEYEYLLQ